MRGGASLQNKTWPKGFWAFAFNWSRKMGKFVFDSANQDFCVEIWETSFLLYLFLEMLTVHQ